MAISGRGVTCTGGLVDPFNVDDVFLPTRRFTKFQTAAM